MKITISADVFRRFNPQLKIAFILVRNLENQLKAEESKHLLKEVENLARLNFHKKEIKGSTFIQPWVLAQLEFGGKARHYHTSVERLLKTVLAGRTIAGSDTIGNVIRYIALKYLIPLGVDDLNKIEGDLQFDAVKSAGRKGVWGSLKQSDLYYKDNKGVLGTQVDYWKNDRTKLTKHSDTALIHLVALPPVDKSELKRIARETASLIETFGQAQTKLFILDKNKRMVTI